MIESQKRRRLVFIAVWLFVCVGLILSVGVTFSGHDARLSNLAIAQEESEHQLELLSRLVCQYRENHPGVPLVNLSQVAAWYEDLRKQWGSVNGGFLPVCFLPIGPKTNRPRGWDTDFRLVDYYADYRMPDGHAGDIIAYERAYLWPDGSTAVCFGPDGLHLTVKRLSEAQFIDWLRTGSLHR